MASSTASNGEVRGAAPSPDTVALANKQVRSPWQLAWRRLRRNRAAIVGGLTILAFIALALLAPFIRPYDPTAQDLANALRPLGWPHVLGTDELGRDILSRILLGSRISLVISASSVGIAFCIGIILGLISGFYGHLLDNILMRCLDVLLAIPGVLLAITIIAALGVGLESLIIAIAISSVPTFARLARGSVLVVRSQEFVTAAIASGATDRRVMLRHILPNIVAPLIVQTSLRLATAILTASGLSFLGLGPQPPSPEWGAMLSTGRQYLTSAPHVAIVPGVAIMLVVFGFNLLGDGLRDALDPRMRS